jgi:hypothetical protein
MKMIQQNGKPMTDATHATAAGMTVATSIGICLLVDSTGVDQQRRKQLSQPSTWLK